MRMTRFSDVLLGCQWAGYNKGRVLNMDKEMEQNETEQNETEQNETEQNDSMTESSDIKVDGGVAGIALNAWYEWSRNNGITGSNVDIKKYELMREAFIDGYLNGFTKRITG